MKRRNVYTVLGVLAILLLTGVVYAAVTGTLHFGGTSHFNKHVDLDIVDEQIQGSHTGDNVYVSANRDTLSFNLAMPEPGQTRRVTFRIKNTGNTNAQLGTLTTTDPLENSGIAVTWPNLNNTIVNAGETSQEYTVEVHWQAAYGSASQDATFSASINYAEAV